MTKEYYAYVENSYGCDYTIGRNRGLFPLEGNTMQEAADYLLEQHLKYAKGDDEGFVVFSESIDELKRIRILEVENFGDLNVDSIRKQYLATVKQRKEKVETIKKKQLYEQLKREFE